jgi:hypothetical protein
MSKFPMKINIRKIPKQPNLFEFTVSTPILRSQFRLPREKVNELRILIERILTDNQNQPEK